ncbi:MAG: ImmA/IrrE family metallo-endopeptidase [Deltaproteobacteria bacterium]|nr:ImmA/IrrE family metallo-endopeptidase [Deltaproteobacteria bacterium]
MPVPRRKSKAKPALLKWARESARLTIEIAAQRAGVKPDAVALWESGEDAPSIPQLRKLAEVYKRPLVVFYLPAPPKDFDALRDFRRLPANAPEESPELAAEIRWAHDMREVAVEAFELTGHEIPTFEVTAKLTESPATVADRLRAALGLEPTGLGNVGDWYEAYRLRREALEQHGVLVFQITGVDVGEARGFSINHRPFPVVAVNAGDAVAARMFTLAHEVVHLALGAGGTCDLHNRGDQDRDRIEVFCNAVAGETLVPGVYLKREPEVRGVNRPVDWDDGTIRDIAARYWVSREVLVRRFLELGLTSPEFYRAKRAAFRKADVPPESGGGNFWNNYRVKYGNVVVAGVMDAYRAGKLTANEAAAYLRLKVNGLEVVQR